MYNNRNSYRQQDCMFSERRAEKYVNRTVPGWVIVISQILLYVFVAMPLRLWFRAKRTLPANVHTMKRGILVAGNHQSLVDPFFVVLNFPFRQYLNILPMRFPTADWVLRQAWNPWFFPVLRFLGCFSIGTTSAEKMKSIFYIRSLLKKDETVFLFPEGRITNEKQVKDLKKGIDFFMWDAHSVMFVRLRGFNGYDGGQSRYSITYGDVLTPPPSMSVEQMTAYLNNLK